MELRIRMIRMMGTVLALGLALGALGACAGGSAPGAQGRALDLYESGDRAGALRAARAVHGRSRGEDRSRAALVAGMSAYELGHLDVSLTWLLPLVDEGNPEIAGRASATLGLVSAARGDHAGAAIRFTNAGRLLSGEEAAQANFFAGECYSMLGRTDAARRAYMMAQGGSRDRTPREQLEHRLSPRSFTVQLGAFSSYTRASSAASEARSRAVRLGLGMPRVVPSEAVTSQMLYLVHVGRFDSEAEAQSARVKMGSEAVVVASVD